MHVSSYKTEGRLRTVFLYLTELHKVILSHAFYTWFFCGWRQLLNLSCEAHVWIPATEAVASWVSNTTCNSVRHAPRTHLIVVLKWKLYMILPVCFRSLAFSSELWHLSSSSFLSSSRSSSCCLRRLISLCSAWFSSCSSSSLIYN